MELCVDYDTLLRQLFRVCLLWHALARKTSICDARLSFTAVVFIHIMILYILIQSADKSAHKKFIIST